MLNSSFVANRSDYRQPIRKETVISQVLDYRILVLISEGRDPCVWLCSQGFSLRRSLNLNLSLVD